MFQAFLQTPHFISKPWGRSQKSMNNIFLLLYTGYTPHAMILKLFFLSLPGGGGFCRHVPDWASPPRSPARPPSPTTTSSSSAAKTNSTSRRKRSPRPSSSSRPQSAMSSGGDVRCSFTTFTDPGLFQSANLPVVTGNETDGYRAANTPVISATVGDTVITDLVDPVVVSFTPLIKVRKKSQYTKSQRWKYSLHLRLTSPNCVFLTLCS